MKDKFSELRKAQQKRQRKALQHRPPRELLQEALGALELQNYENSLALCNQILERDQSDVVVHLLKSRSLYHLGRKKEALSCLEQAVQHLKGSPELYCELGSVYAAQQMHHNAQVAWEAALQIDPRCEVAHRNLGTHYFDLQDWDRAETHLLFVYDSAPNDHANARVLACAKRGQGKIDEAITVVKEAVTRNPMVSANHQLLAALHRQNGDIDRYRDSLHQWLTVDPNNAIAKHMHAALDSTEPTPIRANDDYVREVFDKFAATFDENLESLQYQGPALMKKTLDWYRTSFKLEHQTWITLDAGVGTGLCGPLLREVSSVLVGVDLSSQMIKLAERRDCYDRLVVAEIGEFLSTETLSYDLIVAMDTFNYFGDLEPLFARCSLRLKAGGVVLMSLEHGVNEKTECYQLNLNGRYCHAEAYVESQLKLAGFEVIDKQFETLRREADVPVQSIILLAKKVC